MARLNEQRKQTISKRRQNAMLAHNEIMRQEWVEQIVQEQINADAPDDRAIEQMNEDYDQMIKELHSYLAQELIKNLQNDEQYHYEMYEQAKIKEMEALSKVYDPRNNQFYVCAVCKQFAYIVNGTRIICERSNCIDIDLQVRKKVD